MSGGAGAGDLLSPLAADDDEDGMEAWDSGAPAAVPKPAAGGERGRPPGAVNKKTAMLQKLYAARGFKDPVMWMGELLTMPPVELWLWLREQGAEAGVKAKTLPTLGEVIDLQRKIAADLSPYLHGKMPIRIDHGDERLPVLIIRGDIDQVTIRREREAMSVGGPIVEGETAETSHSEAAEAGGSHGR